jgi:hypothetical protein
MGFKNLIKYVLLCLSSNKVKSFGDHLAIQFIINMDKTDYIQRKITYRKYLGIDIKEFIEDLLSSTPE